MASKTPTYLLYTDSRMTILLSDESVASHAVRFEIRVPVSGSPQVDHPDMHAHAREALEGIPPRGPVRITIEEPTWRGHVWCREGREAAAMKWLRSAAHAVQRGLADGWLWSTDERNVKEYAARHLADN